MSSQYTNMEKLQPTIQLVPVEQQEDASLTAAKRRLQLEELIAAKAAITGELQQSWYMQYGSNSVFRTLFQEMKDELNDLRLQYQLERLLSLVGNDKAKLVPILARIRDVSDT